ncbi:BTAD domain-containing putative transcriptional regulator [Nonomuraea typhae]|uniref:BTAD domain-containing putative transcriptional regulator n=1 Tax=Nonomuraea typhae TaxID=2603600 RepID=A0ABW7ZDU6_9ACTN
MRFRLLGPLLVEVDDVPVPITAPKQRTVLAMLLARAGHVVPVRALVAEVWDERPPHSAVANLRTYLMQLRKLVQAELVTTEAGYMLRVAPEEFDLARFEELATRGRQALARHDPVAAQDAYARALELWRGPAAEDVPLGPTLREVVARLTDQYLSTVEEHTAILLETGAHLTVLGRLRELLAAHPLRERMYGQLMVALYRAGDVAGALEVFGTARRVLSEELGLDPGPELRRLHQAVLSRERDIDLAVPEGRTRPRQLPREPSVFVGRSGELATMLGALRGCAVPPLVALNGPGGMGKSTLALRVAHAVAGQYPDGQLYVDLQGSSPGPAPLWPAEVLGRFLRALGVSEVPAAPAEAAAAYQSVLAERRVLVVLDNAVDAAQVAPLIPASSGCAALITARAALTTLDAVHVAVGALDEAESVRMLALLAGAARIAAETDASAEIARLCGYHPLALRIAGARLAARASWSLPRYAQRLRARRLDELQVADLAVRSCFATGYEALSAAAARAFRLFGVLDVPEIGIEAAVALLGAEPEAGEAALDELAEARLLEPVGDCRFRMHDLLRVFAGELAVRDDPPDERERAVRRALEWYLGMCRKVHLTVEPHLRSGEGAFDDPAEAVEWFETEAPALVAAAAQAAAGEPRFVVDLLPLVKALATKTGRWRELESIARLAAEAAGRLGDRAGEAATLTTLGVVEWRAGRIDAARDCFDRALGLRRELGDREAEGLALHTLGWFGMRTGDLDEAYEHIAAGLKLLEEQSSNRVGMVLHNLGEVLLRLGRRAEAAGCFERCLTLRRANGDLFGESITLAALGRALALLDRREEALAVFATALARCRDTGNREDEWEVLLSRSEIHLRNGARAAAAADLGRALELTARLGEQYGTAAATRQLARALGGEEEARRAAEMFAAPGLRPDPVLEELLTARL